MEINESQSISRTVRRGGRLAVVTMGMKLGDEERGYTRFRFLADLLAEGDFEVDLITSTFQHWNKAQRGCSKACYQELPHRIVFIEEPGYKKNLDLGRILSHRKAAKNLRALRRRPARLRPHLRRDTA